MAPDLNSVPPSPRPLASSPRLTSRTASRRTSQQMAPPALPPSSPLFNILPSNQNAVNHASPLTSPNLSSIAASTAGAPGDNTGVGTGPGPLRHPRPLTAADLHLQLEKEQEAVVNRLTRELSMLRAAQNASVVSNTSSTSAGFPDPSDHSATNHLLSGPSHPTPSQRRHHRSSSSTSTRSITAGLSTASGIAPDRSRASIPPSLSRQNSTTRSGASSPAPPGANPTTSSAHSSYQHPDHFPHFYHQQQRPSLPHREPSGGAPHASEALRGDSVTSVQTTGRYEETAYHRHELEAVKRENDALKRRIRDLERTLRARRQSDASRTRSESVSTTASLSGVGMGIGRGRERDKEGDEDVRVGESARSAGVQR